MKNKKITMKDIALAANVSVATVSHVINGTKKISDNTRKRVLDKIDEFNYVPNSAAKQLRKQSTMTAGLVVSSFPDSFVTRMIFSIEERAKEMGYNLLLINTNEDSQYEQSTIDLLHSQLVDGIIISPTSGDIQYLQKYTDYDFPIVMVNRYDSRIQNIPRVTGDNFQLGYDGTVHLLEHGHENIGMIYSYPNVSTTDNRIKGYKQALEEYNLEFKSEYLVQGYATEKGAAKAIEHLLANQPEVTAVFTQTDLMTIGTIDKLHDLNLSIPGEIAVLGFGDFESAKIIEPPVTNITFSPEIIGQSAFDVLVNKIKNPNYMTHVKLPPAMIVRESCGC